MKVRGPTPRWEPSEIVVLREANAIGISDPNIARMLRRTVASVYQKRRTEGFEKPVKPKLETPFFSGPVIRISDIQSAVARKFEIELHDLMSERRGRGVARPRQVAMYLARELTPHSTPTIGKMFHRDHSTILHGITTVEALIAKNDPIANEVEELRREIAA